MSEVKVNKISPRSGTTITLGDSGDTITIPSGVTLANSGTFTNFQSTGIDDNATSTAITIDSSENVGIGTSSPGANLHIHGGTGNGTSYVTSNDASTSAELFVGYWNETTAYQGLSISRTYGSADVTYNITQSGGQHLFKINSSERMRIDSSGKVGIGTSSPSSQSGDANDLVVGSGSGSNGLTIYSGTTSNGAIRFSDGTTGASTYIGQIDYDHNDNSLKFVTNAQDRMRIDSSGNVGIGTTSPETKLHVADNIKGDGNFSLGTLPSGASSSSYRQAQIANANFSDSGGNNSATFWHQNGYIGSGNNSYAVTSGTGASHASRLGMTSGVLTFSNAYPVTADTQISWSERMRIDSSGNVLIGMTSTSGNGLRLYYNNNGGSILFRQSYGNGFGAVFFYYQTTQVGSIYTYTNSTSYNTSSDYRLKENVSYDFDATSRLKQLKPARFNFTSEPNKTVDGFLAHEVSSVVPEAITGEKDAMKTEEYEVTPAVLDDDGNVITEAVMGTREVPEYQGIDQSKLVPLLVKTIQELEARITTLENA